jgi:hypothetical protein
MWHYFNVLLEVHIKEVWLYNIIIGEFDIFPLMSFSDIVSMNGLPLVLNICRDLKNDVMIFNGIKRHNVTSHSNIFQYQRKSVHTYNITEWHQRKNVKFTDNYVIESNLFYMNFQQNIEIMSHKTGGR